MRKGFVTRTAERKPHVFTAMPRAAVLHTAIERQLIELGATASDRAQLAEALRG